MLEVAELDGEFKPEFEEWAGELGPLAPDTLVPLWWPSRWEGHEMTAQERIRDFAANLEVVFMLQPEHHSPSDSPASGSTSGTRASSTPQRVLRSLIQLRSLVAPFDES